jgi:hypothetical protein
MCIGYSKLDIHKTSFLGYGLVYRVDERRISCVVQRDGSYAGGRGWWPCYVTNLARPLYVQCQIRGKSFKMRDMPHDKLLRQDFH